MLDTTEHRELIQNLLIFTEFKDRFVEIVLKNQNEIGHYRTHVIAKTIEELNNLDLAALHALIKNASQQYELDGKIFNRLLIEFENKLREHQLTPIKQTVNPAPQIDFIKLRENIFSSIGELAIKINLSDVNYLLPSIFLALQELKKVQPALLTEKSFSTLMYHLKVYLIYEDNDPGIVRDSMYCIFNYARTSFNYICDTNQSSNNKDQANLLKTKIFAILGELAISGKCLTDEKLFPANIYEEIKKISNMRADEITIDSFAELAKLIKEQTKWCNKKYNPIKTELLKISDLLSLAMFKKGVNVLLQSPIPAAAQQASPIGDKEERKSISYNQR